MGNGTIKLHLKNIKLLFDSAYIHTILIFFVFINGAYSIEEVVQSHSGVILNLFQDLINKRMLKQVQHDIESF
jgi:hypothetical protein